MRKDKLNARQASKANRGGKTDHDHNPATDDVPLIGSVLRHQGENVLEDEAALVFLRPVHLAWKHDRKEFATFTTMVNASKQSKIAPLRTIQRANSSPPLLGASIAINACHHTEREAAL